MWSLIFCCSVFVASCLQTSQPSAESVVGVPRLGFQLAGDVPTVTNTAAPERGLLIDQSRAVSSVPDSVVDLERLSASVSLVFNSLDLHWTLRREEFGIVASAGFVTAPAQRLGERIVPLTLLPSPDCFVRAVAGSSPNPSVGLFRVPTSTRPETKGIFGGYATTYLSRVAKESYVGGVVPLPQGVTRAELPPSSITRLTQAAPGRFVSEVGAMMLDKYGRYNDIVGEVRVEVFTREIWYLRMLIVDPNFAKRRVHDGRNNGIFDEAVAHYDWCFPIMDANGQLRGEDDPRKNERSTPFENLVTQNLIDLPIKGHLAPIVVPTRWFPPASVSAEELKALKAKYNETETIVLPQRLIDAAGGVVIVRKAASWKPLAQDVIIDADTKNHAGILGVYVSQIVTDERLIDAMSELCGKEPPKDAQRAVLVEAVSKARDRP
jgi:hypothetical protein